MVQVSTDLRDLPDAVLAVAHRAAKALHITDITGRVGPGRAWREVVSLPRGLAALDVSEDDFVAGMRLAGWSFDGTWWWRPSAPDADVIAAAASRGLAL